MTSRREQFRAIFLATVMVVSMVAMGATALAGSAAADVEEDSTDVESNAGGELANDLDVTFDTDAAATNAKLVAGSDEQDLPRLDLEEVDDAGILTDRTLITLPDGLSFNLDESDPTFSGAVERVDDEASEFDNDQTYRIVHDGSGSDEGDRISVRNLVVDADSDIDAAPDGEFLPLEIDTGAGEADFDDLFDVRNNQVFGDDTSVPADGTSDLDEDIAISVPDFSDDELGSNDNLPLAEGTDIEILPNATEGITFDTDETDLDDIELDITDGDGDIDVDDIEITETALTLPVNESFAFTDESVVNVESGSALSFAAEPDAADVSDLEMTYQPTNSTEVVEADTDYQITVDNPNFDIFSDEDFTVPAGVENQVIDDTFELENSNGNIDAAVNIEATDDGQIEDGQNVTLAMNTTDVEFADASEDLTVAFVNYDDDSEPVVNADPGLELYADNNELTFEVDTDQFDGQEDGELADGEGFAIHADDDPDGLVFNVSDGVEDDTTVGFELFTGDDGQVISEPENDHTLTAERVDVEFDSDLDVDYLPVDDAGHSGLPADVTVTPPDADSEILEGDDPAVAVANTNITVDLEDTGVTFDQRSDLEDAGIINDEVATLEDSSLEAELTDTIYAASTNDEDFELSYNITADAVDTDIDVTLNNTFTETVDSTTAEAKDAIADVVTAENGAEDDEEVTADVSAGDTETTTVTVYNESAYDNNEFGLPYGGADVDLEVIDAPTDADTDEVLNTTSLTTSANDFDGDIDSPASSADAAFNFTGEVAGDYSVNATIADGDNVLINYTVDAAEAEAASVEVEENAFRGGTTDEQNTLQTGVFNISLEDEFGNPTETSPHGDEIALDISLTPDANLLEISNDLDKDDGTPDGPFFLEDGDAIINTEELDDGHFYAFVSSSTSGSHDVNLEAVGQNPTPDIDEDSADVRFYAKADNAELDVGDGQINIDDDEREIEAHVEVDGEHIEVPRLNADFNIDNESVATLDEGSAETNTNGVATVNVTPEALGDTTVDVEFTDDRAEDQTAEADISVVETAPNFEVDVDDDSVVEGNDISVDVEIENTGDAEGEQEIDLVVEDEGISASTTVSLDEGASTTESFDLETADLDPDDYTMVASSDDDEAEATLTIDEAVVELDVTLDDIEIFEGNTTDVDVDVENTGNTHADEIDVTLDIEDLDELTQTIEDLSDGDTETATFEDVETDDLEEGDYDMEATATHDDDEASDTATLTVQEVEDDEEEEEEDDGIPGFTAGIAALALLGAALLALRLRSQE